MTTQQRRNLLIGGGLAVLCGFVMIVANLTMPGKFAVIAGSIVIATALSKKVKPHA